MCWACLIWTKHCKEVMHENGGKNSKPVALEFLILCTHLLDIDLQTVSHLTLNFRF